MGETGIVRLRLGAAQAYALQGGHGTVLVDAGISGTQLLLELGRARIGLPDLSLLLITHAHTDHFGGAGALLGAASGLRAAMGRADAAALAAKAGANVDLTPIGAKGALAAAFVRAATAAGRAEPPKPGLVFVPGIQLDGGEPLAGYGVDAEVLAVLGHTHGSMAVLVPDARDEAGRPLGAVAIVGDLVMGGFVFTGRPVPPFFGVMDQIQASLALLKARNVALLFPGHGGPLDADRVWRRFGV